MTISLQVLKISIFFTFCLAINFSLNVESALSQSKVKAQSAYAYLLSENPVGGGAEVTLLAELNGENGVVLNSLLASPSVLSAGWYVMVDNGIGWPESMRSWIAALKDGSEAGLYNYRTSDGNYAWYLHLPSSELPLPAEVHQFIKFYKLQHPFVENSVWERLKKTSASNNKAKVEAILESPSVQAYVKHTFSVSEDFKSQIENLPKEVAYVSAISDLSPQAGSAKSLAINNVRSSGNSAALYSNLIASAGYTGDPNNPGNDPNVELYANGIDRCSPSYQGIRLSPAWCNPNWNHGLNGLGQIVHIIDRRPLPVSGTPLLPIANTGHAALIGKFPNALWFDYTADVPPQGMGNSDPNHGTRVATIIGGDSNGIDQGVLRDPYAAADLALSRDGIASKATLAYSNVSKIQVGNQPIATVLGAVDSLQPDGLVHNLSYAESNEPYTSRTASLDQFIRENPKSVVVAALNNGTQRITAPANCKNCISVGATGDLHPMPKSDGVPVVPFFTNETRVTRGTYSGQANFANGIGPTVDYRSKPDLVMPGRVLSGTYVASGQSLPYSTPDQSATPYGGWTSYSTALVSGMAALVRQYFMMGYYYPNNTQNNGKPNPALCPGLECEPSAALVRAVLLNSTRKITECPPSPPYNCTSNMIWPTGNTGQNWFYSNYLKNDFPGLDQGWGAPTLRTLYFNDTAVGAGGGQFWVRDVPNSTLAGGFDSNGQVASYTFVVSAACANKTFRVSLAWTDLPSGQSCTGAWMGTPQNSISCLLNDLDLEVQTPNGLIYRGNYFDRSQGYSIAGGYRDSLNTSERVNLRIGSATGGGQFIVRVKSANLQPGSVQGYGLAVNYPRHLGGSAANCAASEPN